MAEAQTPEGITPDYVNEGVRDSLAALQQTPDYNTAMMNLKSGLVDAVAIDIGVAQYYLSQQG